MHELVCFFLVFSFILHIFRSSCLNLQNVLAIIVYNDLLANLFGFVIFNEKVFVKLADDLQGHKVLHNIKYCFIKDYDKVTDNGNEVADDSLTKACQVSVAPSRKLPLVIHSVFHLVHAVTYLLSHLRVHGETRDESG